jgi:hypothetical protein
VRRLIFTLSTVLAVITVLIVTSFFRIIDAVLYRRFKKVVIKDPIFIVSNPRSGTTYLQRLLSEDERLSTLKLYHTLLPAISFYKLVHTFDLIDKKIGSPLKRILGWVSKWFFSVWDDIHKSGLNQAEEDEGFWFLTGLSPAWAMITPYREVVYNLVILDDLPFEERRRIGKMYKDFLMRFMYMYPNRRLLVKSVMSAGRLGIIKEVFPDAKIIVTERNPLKTVPSYVSMFSKLWTWHSPSPSKRQLYDLGLAAIEFQRHLTKFKITATENECLEIVYEDFIKATMTELKRVYAFLGIDMAPQLISVYRAIIDSRKMYSSKHTYRLSDYGYTDQKIQDLLAV